MKIEFLFICEFPVNHYLLGFLIEKKWKIFASEIFLI